MRGIETYSPIVLNRHLSVAVEIDIDRLCVLTHSIVGPLSFPDLAYNIVKTVILDHITIIYHYIHTVLVPQGEVTRREIQALPDRERLVYVRIPVRLVEIDVLYVVQVIEITVDSRRSDAPDLIEREIIQVLLSENRLLKLSLRLVHERLGDLDIVFVLDLCVTTENRIVHDIAVLALGINLKVVELCVRRVLTSEHAELASLPVGVRKLADL